MFCCCARTRFFRIILKFRLRVKLSRATEFFSDDPEPVIEKDSLNQECKWFNFSDYDKTFFDLPMPELLELVMAANYLDIPRLYHYACQSVAARIKGKQPREICDLLQQDCDLDRARMKEIYGGNPWLAAVVPGARIKVSGSSIRQHCFRQYSEQFMPEPI